jgi:DNA helicase-2/ATP-dependent DNA helicase PcrA
MTELAASVEHESVGLILDKIVRDTGYREMLKAAATPEAESRLENVDELVNAAAEASTRGESPSEFLDHAALVAQADALDNQAQVSLLTIHNAKGLEWPIVFIAGLEDGLFPHARSLNSDAHMEEERRLCYVGMTRAEKKLFLTWARARRKFGGGPLEPRMTSRFLIEVPTKFTTRVGERPAPSHRDAEVDLFAEQHAVRQAARKHSYTGKTYNSVENISQFFQERGLQPPPAAPKAQPALRKAPPSKLKSSASKPALRSGVTVNHPRYGRGLVLRREGDGEDAKLTVNFPGHGLKKLLAKYAGLKVAE